VSLGSIDQVSFQRQARSLLQSVMNDLKRDVNVAARELEIGKAELEKYLDGSQPIDFVLLERVAAAWPVNLRDLLPFQDDAPEGVLLMTADESRASGRVMSRAGMAYYEYRDTAMSRVASYRPEWIRMLAEVSDSDPGNPTVKWNRGHLLYQFTYFIGPVNYYYRWGSEAKCIEMNTGDSVWGVPYAPHSFTSRSSSKECCILALTYGDCLTDSARLELSVRGRQDSSQIAIRPKPASGVDPALIRSYLSSQAMPVATLSELSGIPLEILKDVLSGCSTLDSRQLNCLALAFRVSPRDLLAVVSQTAGGIRVLRTSAAEHWPYPSADDQLCTVRRLAGDSAHPHTSALEVDFTTQRSVSFSCAEHQYLYALEASDLDITWSYDASHFKMEMHTGDSACIKPCVDLQIKPRTLPAKILLLRIAGRVSPEARYQLGAMAPEGIDRFLIEDGSWF
jgi:hypothetical protein